MSNQKCDVCGHVNRAGAADCEMCNAGLRAAPSAPYAPAFNPNAFAPVYAPVDVIRPGALPTDIPSPHFQGVGDVIAPTLELYRKHFTLVCLLVLLTSVPVVVLDYGTYSIFGDGRLSSGLFPFFWGGATLVPGLRGFLFHWFVSLTLNSMLAGALVYAVVELQRRGAARASDCLRWGAEKLFKVLATNVACALIAYVAPAVALALMATLFGPLAVLLLVPAFFLWVFLSATYSMAVPAAAAENRGVSESLKRSAELTRGHKGLVFLTYFLWWLITTAVSLFITYSFSAGAGWSGAAVVVQTLVVEFLKSTTYVLTTYIFLGILNERRHAGGAQAAALP
jgi:hypothetical protein